MTSKADEGIYHCEVKKLFMRGGEKREEWVTIAVVDAIRDGVTRFRCKDCHGAVRLHGKTCRAWARPPRRTLLSTGLGVLPSWHVFQAEPRRPPATIKHAGKVRQIMAECPESLFPTATLDRLLQKHEFSAFVSPWIKRAEQREEPFESLIHLWVAFNAWMSEIITPATFMEQDAALIAAAARDPTLKLRFTSLMEVDDGFRKKVHEFQSSWPVFNSRQLDEAQIGPWESESLPRNDYRQLCFDKVVVKNYMRPRCYREHQDQSEALAADDPAKVPLDWPHTLSAIYQVRSNLFHGGKSFRMQSDVRFAKVAFEILWAVWAADFSRD